ncbi:YesL family protein [Amphibacillus jilinensis]|uniref:YesL family protein n=1 Tax=Amphibacillus jilinensis TaxID=1216008 RepID=UPI0002F13B86|nr:DUF624 domain-containing protein [Amphibacillus jilinensis]
MSHYRSLGKVYLGFEFIYRLVYLNLLWTTFSLIGGILFGIGPSTLALYHVNRKWLRKELGSDRDIFKHYFTAYKRHFITGNLIGLSLIVLFFIFLVNYRYASARSEIVFQFIQVATVVLSFVAVIILTYLFPLYVHYQLPLKVYYLKSWIVALAHPVPTVLNLVWLMLIGYLTYRLFPFSLLLTMSSLAYGIMGISYSCFIRNDQMVLDKDIESLS